MNWVAKTTRKGDVKYARRMRGRAEAVLRGEEPLELAELRRGWCLGSESFRERMLRLLDLGAEKLPRRSPRDARVWREHGEEEAGRLIAAGLRYFGLAKMDLPALRKSDERKLVLAALVRQRTNVSNAWLAEALQLGHISRVSHALRQSEGLKLSTKLSAALLRCAPF